MSERVSEERLKKLVELQEVRAEAARAPESPEVAFWQAEEACIAKRKHVQGQPVDHPPRLCGSCTAALLTARDEAWAARVVAAEQRAKAAEEAQRGLLGQADHWRRVAASLREGALQQPEPCPPSSVTGAPCLLPPGHPPDSPTRFHRYKETP